MKDDKTIKEEVFKVDPAIQLLTEVHAQMDPNAPDDDIEKSVKASLDLWQNMNSHLQKIMNAHQRLDELWFKYKQKQSVGRFGAFDKDIQIEMGNIVNLINELDAIKDYQSAPNLTVEGYCKAIQNDYEKYSQLMARVIDVEDKLMERYPYALENVAVRRSHREVPQLERWTALTELNKVFQLTKDNNFKPYAQYLFELDPYQATKLYVLTLRHAKNREGLNKLVLQDVITPEEKLAFKQGLIQILKTQTGLMKANLWQNVPTPLKKWLNASPAEEVVIGKDVRIQKVQRELKTIIEKLKPEERQAFIDALDDQLKKVSPKISFDIVEEYGNSPTNSTENINGKPKQSL